MMALVAVLSVALATSSLAHRFETPSGQSLETYLATMGFDLTDVCGGERAGETRDCGACLLQAAMALPEPANGAILRELGLSPVDWLPEPARLSAQTRRVANPARAPPSA